MDISILCSLSRTQQIVCGGCYLGPAEFLSGVPQCIQYWLRPLIYINNISCHLKINMLLYRQIETQVTQNLTKWSGNTWRMGKDMENETEL